MPSGYTAPVAEGKITDINQFVTRCARAFGALISMRDDPLDAPLPERIEPISDYHVKALERAKERLSSLSRMSKSDIERECRLEYERAMETWREWVEESNLKRRRYQDMRAKVLAWEPPSPNHEGLKQFMLEQLSESERYDCHDYQQPEQQNPDDWYSKALSDARNDIAYHTQKQQEEEERTRERNEWLQTLRRSLV